MTKEVSKKVPMTPEQRRAFLPVLAGLIIFSLTCGANTAISSAFFLFAEKFSVSISKVVIASSCMTGAGFIMMQFSGKYMKKFGVKSSMVISLLGIAAGFVIMAFAPNVYFVWLGFACMATTHAFGQASAMSAIIRGWVAPRYQGSYMGLVLGTFICGGAIYPALGSYFFSTMSITNSFLLLIPIFLIPALIGVALVKNSAADAGVKPIGWEQEDETAMATGENNIAAEPKKKFNMYAAPVFWVCGLTMILQTVLTSQLTLLVTTLQMAGVATVMAGTIASICSLIGFPANLIGGWIKDKFGLKPFMALSYILVFFSSLCMYLFFTTGNNVMLWSFILLNALCRPYMNVYAFSTGPIFKENAMVVQPKLQSFSNLASIILLPLVSKLAEMWGGYARVCWIWMAIAIIIIPIWGIAYKMAEKESQA